MPLLVGELSAALHNRFSQPLAEVRMHIAAPVFQDLPDESLE
jgi:hypothetical protein